MGEVESEGVLGTEERKGGNREREGEKEENKEEGRDEKKGG